MPNQLRICRVLVTPRRSSSVETRKTDVQMAMTVSDTLLRSSAQKLATETLAAACSVAGVGAAGAGPTGAGASFVGMTGLGAVGAGAAAGDRVGATARGGLPKPVP